MASRKKKASPSTNVGCFVLLVGGIVLLILFAIKFPDIKQTLEKTNFLVLISQRKTITKPSTSTSISTSTSTSISTSTSTLGQPSSASTLPAAHGDVKQVTLYFVRIDEDGLISSKEVRRSIVSVDSPLADAIKALISGPSEAEIRSGLVSLVPRGTKLLGIVLRGSTAVIDLSESFMYNRYGSEGFGAQLKQIVYTATAFASVQDVQILVEGKARDYLGGEGIYIGKPLSRNSF